MSTTPSSESLPLRPARRSRWFAVALIAPVVTGVALALGMNREPSAPHSDAPEPVLPIAATNPTPAVPLAAKVDPPVVVTNRDGFQKHVAPFLKQHCVACHGAEKAKGGLRLDALEPDFVNSPHAAAWGEVLDRVNRGEMPPKDRPRPDAKELDVVTRWIAAEFRGATARAQSSGGRVPLRRLNRTEYANTVRDLFGVTFVAGEGPEDLLPPDGRLAGFDKLGKALPLDSTLMDRYFRAATLVAERAVATRPPRVLTHTSRFEFEDTPRFPAISHVADHRATIIARDGLILMGRPDDGSAAYTHSSLDHPASGTVIPVRGRYTVRVRAAADPGARKEPVYMDVGAGSEGLVAKYKVEAPLDRPQVYEFTRIFDPRSTGGFAIYFPNGTRFSEVVGEGFHLQQAINAAATAGRFADSVRLQARGRAAGFTDVYHRSRPNPETLDLDRVPKLFIDYIEVEGPLNDPWPPRSRQTIFFDGLAVERQTPAYARAIFERLLPRAYRRPVTKDEVQRVAGVVEKELRQGESFEEAVKAGLVVMLCSPNFLLQFESGDAKDAPRKLNDYELAARLSYFLWSSLPDDELTRLAAAGRLRDPKTFDAQIDRMLADPKGEALVDGFATQWLKVDEFDRFKPDRRLYPFFYLNENAGLGEDVKREPLAVFREVLSKNESALTFLRADWTMLNERLARLYGVEGVRGEEFRRVKLPAGSPRGGLVGMAGVHQWGSDGNRTKPVNRGKYVLDVLFNDPPDPPPPNAGEVQPNTDGKRLTVRERLALHRTVESCANCHNRIDPYGLALENFNAIGQWRDVQDGETQGWGPQPPRVDPSGSLPSGREFKTVHEFKQALADQSDRFLTGLAGKMFVYAVGRTVEPTDRATLEKLVQAMKADGHSLRSLIKGVVTTEAFRSK
jgi:mono/diheme cytochrome c family protein